MTHETWGTSYPNFRSVVGERCEALSDAELELAFATTFGEGVGPAEYEDFFGSLGSVLGSLVPQAGQLVQRVAPTVAPVAQGALQGALSGAPLGLPGIIAGAVAGGAGSTLSQQKSAPARDIGRALSGGVNTFGGLLGGGAGLPSAALGAHAGGSSAGPQQSGPSVASGGVSSNLLAGLLGALSRRNATEAFGYGEASEFEEEEGEYFLIESEHFDGFEWSSDY